jgi:DNA-binding protein H-NS
MSQLKELLQQREAIEQAIAQALQSEKSAAISQAKAIVSEYGLTVQDVFTGRSGKSTKSQKVAPKYRDPSTGNTWTGRGKAPVWIGNDRDRFLISA